jgi:hypothetical protein
VGCRAHSQVDIRLRDAKIAKEGAGHPGVIVLACMDKPNLMRFPEWPKRLKNGRDFHEVGPGTSDEEEFHFS